MIGNDYLISDSVDPNNIYNEVNMKINEGDTILCEVILIIFNTYFFVFLMFCLFFLFLYSIIYLHINK